MSHPINQDRAAHHAELARRANRATLGEILAASQPDARTLPPEVRYYAKPGQRSPAARSLDAEPDPWAWAEKAAQ